MAPPRRTGRPRKARKGKSTPSTTSTVPDSDSSKNMSINTTSSAAGPCSSKSTNATPMSDVASSSRKVKSTPDSSKNMNTNITSTTAVPCSSKSTNLTPKLNAVPGPSRLMNPTPRAVAVPGPSRLMNPTPGAVAVPGPSRLMNPTPRAVAVPGPSRLMNPTPRAVAVPGPSRLINPTPGAVAVPGPSRLMNMNITPFRTNLLESCSTMSTLNPTIIKPAATPSTCPFKLTVIRLDDSDEEKSTIAPPSAPRSDKIVAMAGEKEIDPARMRLILNRILHRSHHFIPLLLDEIALEGLDGITFQALWVRLGERPGFNLSIVDKSKMMFYESLKSNYGLKWYKLPEARGNLVIFNRNEFVDVRGNCCEPVSSPEEIYLYNPINEIEVTKHKIRMCNEMVDVDVETNIRGSCPHYTTRKDVTAEALKMNYEEAEATFGNQLVVVASQAARSRVLFSDNLDVESELSIIQYCMLERIGRSRFHGESTRGKVSLGVMKIDPKTLFYQRISLLNKKLITKQPYAVKVGNSHAPSLVTILHLPKYFMPYYTSLIMNIRKCFNHLRNEKYYREPMARSKEKYGKHAVGIFLTPEWDHLFEKVMVPMAELYPEQLEGATDRRKEGLRTKTVLALQLKDPYFNLDWYLQNKAKSEEEDKDNDDDAQDKNIFVYNEVRAQTTTLVKTWQLLLGKAAEGITIREICSRLNLYSLDARSATKLMTRLKLAVMVLEDSKKTKFQRYIYHKCQEANRILVLLSDGRDQHYLTNHGITSSEGVTLNYSCLEENENNRAQLILAADAPRRQAEISQEMEEYVRKSLANERPTSSVLPETEKIKPQLKIPRFKHSTRKILLRMKGEDKMFVEVDQESDSNQDQIIPLPTFETTENHWEVAVKPADVNSTVKTQAMKSTSLKTVERASFMCQLIDRRKFLVGFHHIITGVRNNDTRCRNSVDVDPRTILRIMAGLKKEGKLRIWKISLSTSHFHTYSNVFTVFTSQFVNNDSPAFKHGVKHLIHTVEAKLEARFTKELNKVRAKSCRAVARKASSKSRAKLVEKIKKKANQQKAIRRNVMAKYPSQTPLKPDLVKKKLIYDDVDLEALKRLRKGRVDWTEVEDEHLLLLFIASILFLPIYNIHKITMYNSFQIRDALHKKLEISNGKTAPAIRRRFQYLIKKDSFFVKYRDYLNKAINDQYLKDAIKDQYPIACVTIYRPIPDKGLMDVYEYLLAKFKNDGTPLPRIGGSSILKRKSVDTGAGAPEACISEAARLKFMRKRRRVWYEDETPVSARVVAPGMADYLSTIINCCRAPQSLQEIKLANIKSVIMSLLFNAEKYEYVEYYLNLFDSPKISQVLRYLNERQITVVSKKSLLKITPATKKLVQIHLSPCLYGMYNEILTRVEETGKMDCMRYTSCIAAFLLIDLCSYSMDSRTLGTVEIVLPENAVEFSEDWKEVLQIAKQRLTETEISKLKNTPLKAQCKTVRSKVTKGMDGMDGPLAKPDEVATSSKKASVQLEKNATSSEDETNGAVTETCKESVHAKVQIPVVPKPDTTSFNLRDYRSRINALTPFCNKPINTNCLNLVLPNVSFHINKDVLQHFVGDDISENFDVQASLTPLLLKVIPNLAERQKVDIPKDYIGFTRLIFSAREKGLELKMLKLYGGKFIEALKFLMTNFLVYVVGTNIPTLVGFPYIESWSMPHHPRNSSLSARVISRPWVTCSGDINWRLVDELFCSLMGYIELTPNAYVKQVVQCLIPIVTPIDAAILLFGLHKLGLVRLFEITESKASLMSKPVAIILTRFEETEHERLYFARFDTLCAEIEEFHIQKYVKIQEHLVDKSLSSKESLFTTVSKLGLTSFTAMDPKRRKAIRMKMKNRKKVYFTDL